MKKQFKIKTSKDILKLQMALKDNFEVQHIAQELAKNIIEEGQTGVIKIKGNEITSVVDLDEQKEVKLEEAINKVNSNYENKDNSSVSDKKDRKRRGIGLFSIRCLGWKLNFSKSSKTMSVKAAK